MVVGLERELKTQSVALSVKYLRMYLYDVKRVKTLPD